MSLRRLATLGSDGLDNRHGRARHHSGWNGRGGELCATDTVMLCGVAAGAGAGAAAGAGEAAGAGVAVGSVTGVVLDGVEPAVEPVEPDGEPEDVDPSCDEEPVGCEPVAVESVGVVELEPVESAGGEAGGVDVESAGVELRGSRALELSPGTAAVPLSEVVGAGAGSVAEAEGVVGGEPVSAAAGRASANAHAQRQARSTARRAADKRSEHTPTFSLPANYTSPETLQTPDVLVLRASYHLRRRSASSRSSWRKD